MSISAVVVLMLVTVLLLLLVVVVSVSLIASSIGYYHRCCCRYLWYVLPFKWRIMTKFLNIQSTNIKLGFNMSFYFLSCFVYLTAHPVTFVLCFPVSYWIYNLYRNNRSFRGEENSTLVSNWSIWKFSVFFNCSIRANSICRVWDGKNLFIKLNGQKS